MASRVILDLCSGSGAWSQPYVDAGYSVKRYDLPNDIRLLWHDPGIHVRGILAAPPCTVFAKAGNTWLRSNSDYIDALSVVDACLRAVFIYKPAWWALENPVGKLTRWLGEPTLRFDPCDYGDPWTKKTCLWGSFNNPKPNYVAPTEKDIVGRVSSGPKQAAIRSITPPGFAKAFFEANP